jgi:broad specificity phosphatase PhoE
MTVYLLRHGRTEMNRQGLLQGQGGFGLLPEGRRDAERAAGRLAGRGVALVFSSDQRRALESAAILRERLRIGTPARLSILLREMDFGRMTGLPADEVERRCPAWRKDPAFRFPGGESYRGLQDRALSWFGRLERRRPAPVVAVVTHGAWLRTFLAALAGVPLERCLRGAVPHGLVARVETDGALRRLRLLAAVTSLPR